MRNIKKISLAVILLISSLGFVGFFASKSDVYFEIAKNLELLGKVYKEISYNYVDQINTEKFMRAGIKGMLGTLDPYTIFVDESKQQDIDLMTNGKYGGIGISIGVRDEEVTILEIMDGYSAQKQGLRVGDILIEAGGSKINADNVDEVSKHVKGEPGTTVDLKILRNEKKDTLSFSVIREMIVIKNITYADFFPKNSNNAYIKLSNFSRTAGTELLTSLKNLAEQKKIESIILDLRGNPGGLLDVAVDICEKYLKKNQLIVSTKGRDLNTLKEFYSEEEPIAGNQKLVVLINGSSASASEIVAGAMQDHDRGVIVGTKSFGKGLVQTIIPLTGNTSLKITTAKYYTPSGRCIQKIDYSKDNLVIENADSVLTGRFKTDNDRIVYSAGGITPDSTVEYEINGDITKQLLAKGIIFSFANKYYYENKESGIGNIKDSKLKDEFKKYLHESDFTYTTEIQKKLNEIVTQLDKNSSSEISNSVKNLKSVIENSKESDFELYEAEIIGEIKIELAHRFGGSSLSWEERLKIDPQTKVALDILKNNNLYNELLNKN